MVRPGTASCFTRKFGRKKLWMTSSDRTRTSTGRPGEFSPEVLGPGGGAVWAVRREADQGRRQEEVHRDKADRRGPEDPVEVFVDDLALSRRQRLQPPVGSGDDERADAGHQDEQHEHSGPQAGRSLVAYFTLRLHRMSFPGRLRGAGGAAAQAGTHRPGRIAIRLSSVRGSPWVARNPAR